MQETFEQYKRRILSYLGGQNPMRVQSRTVAAIETLLKGVPAARLRKRPAPGKWSVGEILAHMADTEIVCGYRVRSILGAPGTPIIAFDQDRWADSQNYAKRDARVSLRLLQTLREANLLLLKSLRADQWMLSGMHTERGEESIEAIARLIAGHDINHLRQIESILKAKRK